jgi:hypothetical protein
MASLLADHQKAVCRFASRRTPNYLANSVQHLVGGTIINNISTYAKILYHAIVDKTNTKIGLDN